MCQILDNTEMQLLSGNIESDEIYKTPNFRWEYEMVHKIPDHTHYGILIAGEIGVLRMKGKVSRGLSK